MSLLHLLDKDIKVKDAVGWTIILAAGLAFAGAFALATGFGFLAFAIYILVVVQ